jgi:hypothetical protein
MKHAQKPNARLRVFGAAMAQDCDCHEFRVGLDSKLHDAYDYASAEPLCLRILGGVTKVNKQIHRFA